MLIYIILEIGGIKLNIKTLESERLILKPLSFDELMHINNNQMNTVEISIELDSIPDSIKSAISKKIEKMRTVNINLHEWYTYWLIIYKNNEKGIGFIGFKGIPDINGYSEVGYNISPKYRKKRLMSEALKVLLEWASTYKECSGITAKKVLKTNVGSNKVLNSCNFKLVNYNEQEHNYLLKFE